MDQINTINLLNKQSQNYNEIDDSNQKLQNNAENQAGLATIGDILGQNKSYSNIKCDLLNKQQSQLIDQNINDKSYDNSNKSQLDISNVHIQQIKMFLSQDQHILDSSKSQILQKENNTFRKNKVDNSQFYESNKIKQPNILNMEDSQQIKSNNYQFKFKQFNEQKKERQRTKSFKNEIQKQCQQMQQKKGFLTLRLQYIKKFIISMKKLSKLITFKNLEETQFNMIGDISAFYKFYILNNIIKRRKDYIGQKVKLFSFINPLNMNIFQEFINGKYLFSLDSFWRFAWDILMIFFILYLLIMIPLSHVFGDHYGVFIFIHQNFIKWTLVIEIFINLNSEIYSNGVTIKDRYIIFKKTNWKIMIDLLLYVFFLYSIYYKDLKHKMSYLDFLLFIKYREIPSKLSELETKFQISDSLKNWLKLLKLELSVLILAHVACCIFLLIGQHEKDNNKDNWIDKYNYSNYTIVELYLTSFYFLIISICTVGYGDIAPCTIIERGFIILVALISTNITAYSFSQISEIVKFEDSKKESFNKVMVGINFQMKLNCLGMNLQQKVRKYFEYLHSSDLQKSHIQESLLDRLPNHLKEEVLLEMNKQFISAIQIFKGFSPQCLKMISLSIKQKQLLPDQIAIQEKEFNESLYFISQGTLQLFCSVSQKQDETIFENGVTLLKKQDSFGYEGFLYGEICPYSIKSVGQSVISYLEKEQFLQIIKNFPLDYEKFCFIRDKQIYDSFQKVVYRLKCISCQEQDHYPNHCQFINPTVKYKNDKSINTRNFFQRTKTRNSNVLKNNKYYQDIAVALAFMKDDTLTAQQDTVNENSQVIDQSYISDDLQSFHKIDQIIKKNNVYEAPKKSKDLLQVDYVLEDKANLRPKSLNELNTNNSQLIVLNVNSEAINENSQQNNNNCKNDNDIECKQIQEQGSSISCTQSIKSLALSDLSDQNKIKNKEENQSDKGKQQEFDKTTFNNHRKSQDLFFLQSNNLSINIDDNRQMNSGQQNSVRLELIKQKLGKNQNQKFTKSYFSQQLSSSLEPQIAENQSVQNQSINNKILTNKQKSLNTIDLKSEDNQSFRKRSNSEIQLGKLQISKISKPQQKLQKTKVSDKAKNQNFSKISSLLQNATLINKRAHLLNDNKMKFSYNQQKEADDNQLDSNEYQIRFMLNLQDLDMLVVRKEYLLMQQKNQISDYIQVPDNELDIDILHNYKYYYFNGNFKQVLQRIKTRDDKNKDALSPNKKKTYRKSQRKTNRYKPTSFNIYNQKRLS
ncbi:hypothetical protein ABPG74_000713 [Tetrahymena malaccensis]